MIERGRSKVRRAFLILLAVWILLIVGLPLGAAHAQDEGEPVVPGGSTRWVVLALVVLVIVFRAVSYLVTRQRTGTRGVRPSYGYLGGTVCPNCSHPYAIHWWSPRLLGLRLDRCPHCGKWKPVQRASPQALAEAEEFIAGSIREDADPPVPGTTAGELSQRKLDDSRYQDA